ncbi:hypothetical protein KKA86_09035 [bacterium]|nr:hypothetical protein [bacterium]MCG2762510.1 hypothetical protein [Candidatus Atribacteria bacterium]
MKGFFIYKKDYLGIFLEKRAEEVRYVYIFILQLAPQGARDIYKRAKKIIELKVNFLNLKGE